MLALAALATLATAAFAAPPGGNNNNAGGLAAGNVFADFNGQSGSFRLYLQATNQTDLSKRFWNINWQNVVELKQDGSEIQSTRENIDLSWTTGVTAWPNDVFSNSVVGQQTLGNGALLTVRHDVFLNETIVQIGNETSAVTVDILKVSIMIENYANWDQNAAFLGFRVKVNDNFGANNGPIDAGENNGMETVLMPGSGSVTGVLNFETSAIVDNNTTSPVPVDVSRSGNIFTLQFPKFTSLTYDPTVLGVDGASSLVLSFGAIIAVAFALFALF